MSQHNYAYNFAFTEDLKTAIFNRDSDWVAKEIMNLARQLIKRKTIGEFEGRKHDPLLTRLLLCLAFLDSMERRGQTIQMIADLVNF